VTTENVRIRYEDGKISLYDVPKLYKVNRTETVPAKGPENTGQEFVLNDFISSIKGGRRPQTDVFDNIHSIAMVFAAVKAVRTGKRIPVLDKRVQQLIGDV